MRRFALSLNTAATRSSIGAMPVSTSSWVSTSKKKYCFCDTERNGIPVVHPQPRGDHGQIFRERLRVGHHVQHREGALHLRRDDHERANRIDQQDPHLGSALRPRQTPGMITIPPSFININYDAIQVIGQRGSMRNLATSM